MATTRVLAPSYVYTTWLSVHCSKHSTRDGLFYRTSENTAEQLIMLSLCQHCSLHSVAAFWLYVL